MENSNEIWLPAKGLEGLYEVSSLGRVRSLPREIMRPNGKRTFVKGSFVGWKDLKGYVVFRVRLEAYKKIQFRVHRLVYNTFVGEIPSDMEIDHIDRNKQNNSIENLRILDRRSNSNNRNTTLDNIGAYKNKHNSFVSFIYYNGKQYQLGSYKTENEASEIYNKAVSSIKEDKFIEFYSTLNKKKKNKDTPKYISFRKNRLVYSVDYKGRYFDSKTLEDAIAKLEEFKKDEQVR